VRETGGGQRGHNHDGHRRLPPTPRKPSTLACQFAVGSSQPGSTSQLVVANVNQIGAIGQQQKSPSMLHTAGTPQSHLSFGVNSNMTVASERNDREQFLRSGVNPGYGGIRQNGTYSSHPNLPTFDPQTHPSQLPAFPPIEPPAMQKMAPLPRPPAGQGGSHRKLPALPKQPSSLKLQTWRQSSLPERQNPPGLDFDVPLCAPSENHMARDVADRQRRLKPITPTKPSTLSFRQSSLNGPPTSFAIFPNQPYQMPKKHIVRVNASPSSTGLNGHVRHAETMVHFNGSGAPQHRTHLPSLRTNNDHRTLSLGRALPLAPAPPPPPAPADHKVNYGEHKVNFVEQKSNGYGNGSVSGLFRGTSQEVDWI